MSQRLAALIALLAFVALVIAALVTAQGYAMLNLIAAAGFTVSAVMILSMPRTKAPVEAA